MPDEIHLVDITIWDYEISLTRLIGKSIKDVRGYLSDLGGGAALKITRIQFEDGTFVDVEGEHDFPYLTGDGVTQQPHFDEATLERLQGEAG